jgi:adenylyltransferase/sulfurtransferase
MVALCGCGKTVVRGAGPRRRLRFRGLRRHRSRETASDVDARPAIEDFLIPVAKPNIVPTPTPDKLQITANDTAAAQEDRFHRFRLIGWWDQEKLARAKVLVVGAGALGNEIVKNLALLGVGRVLIADMDRIENSNLSRSVLFRASDNGAYKAQIAARAAAGIYPDIKVASFNGNIVYDLGIGVYRWADVVIGGLDNREARLAINRNCWKVNKPWIDGAIEQIQGTARVFVPDGDVGESPCYECTMSQTDWKLLQNRRSCNLLTRPEMEGGKTPTTPTISSIIAGVQCQEAVKLLHGMETIAGRGWVFAGLTTDSYAVTYQRNDDCYSHDPLEQVIALDAGADSITLAQLLQKARELLGPTAELELGRDVLEKLVCPKCREEEPLFMSLGKVGANKANCPTCPGVRREVVTFHKVRGTESFLNRTPAGIGVPAFDIVIARTATRAIGLELAADANAVLGPVA